MSVYRVKTLQIICVLKSVDPVSLVSGPEIFAREMAEMVVYKLPTEPSIIFK